MTIIEHNCPIVKNTVYKLNAFNDTIVTPSNPIRLAQILCLPQMARVEGRCALSSVNLLLVTYILNNIGTDRLLPSGLAIRQFSIKPRSKGTKRPISMLLTRLCGCAN